MRTIVISDIHGCYKELRALLKKIQYSPKKDDLVINGDLMDRGKDSYKVWDYLINLKKQNDESCALLWGNHELMLCEAYGDSGRISRNWDIWGYNGRDDTLRSFKENGVDGCKDIVRDIRKYFNTYVMLEDLALISHAGTVNEDVKEMPFYELVWNRDVSNGYTYYDGLQIIGHTPSREPHRLWFNSKTQKWELTILEYNKRRVLPKSGVINIDTACVYDGKLTAMCIYDDGTYKLFSVNKGLNINK